MGFDWWGTTLNFGDAAVRGVIVVALLGVTVVMSAH